MDIRVEGFEGVSVLHCDGSLDAETAGNFKDVAVKLVDDGKTKLVVDCERMSYVDSIGLGALISVLRKARQQQGDVKLSSLTDNVKTVFEITRLYRLFEIFSNWESAAKKF